MPKPTNTKNVYEKVTAQIVAQLQQGVIPWHKPWTTNYQPPRNLKSGRPYRGINVFVLALQGYASPYWLTFKQALDMGGNVRKGEKGTTVLLWKTSQIEDAGSGETKVVPFARAFTVFNVAQCEGVEAPVVEVGHHATSPIAACEEVVDSYQGRPQVEHGGDRACYSPLRDTVSMPEPKTFDTMAHYYATLFHEFGHSTGHQTRLKRPGIVNFDTFGSHQYSQEELVAEMTAAFLVAQTGIDASALLDNSAAYIGSWLKKLQDEPKMVVQAAAQAQKAADTILGVKWDEKPANDAAEQKEAA